MRAVFFGHDETAVPFLEILKTSVELLAIVIPSNRDRVQVEPLEKFANKHQIKLFVFKNPNSKSALFKIKKLNSEIGFVYNYSHIFSQECIDLFPKGLINFHGGLLPDYRGANIINWVLINGEKKTGVTAHFLTKKIDSGPVIKEIQVPISKVDDGSTLKNKLAKATYRILKQVLQDSRRNRLVGRETSREGRYYRRRFPEDGKINFQKSALEIYNLVRALVHPWPGAYGIYNHKKIILDKVRVVNEKGKPGEILKVAKQSAVIGTGDKAIMLLKVRNGKINSLKVGKVIQ